MRTFFRSFWPLFVITAGASATLSGYLLADISPPPIMIDLWDKVFGFWVLIGIQNDARLRKRTPCFDFGFLIWVTAIISVPWYFWSSRGFFKGMLILLMLAILLALPQIVFQIVWTARYG
jgi:hypothetical protein